MSAESVNQRIDGGDGDGDGGAGNEEKKPIGYGRKAKRMVLSKIKKAKKQLQRSKSKENRHSVSRSSSGTCCLFIRRIPTLDSSSGSPTSDPNASEFAFDSLRGLIEKSDFLSNECNTHLDVYTTDDNDNDNDDDD